MWTDLCTWRILFMQGVQVCDNGLMWYALQLHVVLWHDMLVLLMSLGSYYLSRLLILKYVRETAKKY